MSTLPSSEQAAPSLAAERMRVHRERRLRGLKCVLVQIRAAEIDALVTTGLLDDKMRADRRALAEAVHRHLDRTLCPPP
jgi:hypothetical protein